MSEPVLNMALSGANILYPTGFARGTLFLADGVLADPATAPNIGAVDLTGYLVLPGIIDLHGDAFERHLAPRPSAPFPSDMALAAVDRDAAVNGVTTAWLAQSWSWEGGSRGPDFAERFMADLAAYRPRSLTDLRLQVRCETHTVETADRLIAALERFGVDYVVFNDHLGEALQMIAADPEALAIWAKRAGREVAAHIALVRQTATLAPRVPRYLCTLATAFDRLGIRYGSHDDRDAAVRDYYTAIGARICEFPTGRASAQVAKTNGDPVLMGAPNVVRGGSQSGNVSAQILIEAGLCDALVSDYHYPALARAAFDLADRGVMGLDAAWRMISAAPARIMGLSDRGEIENGKRADLVIYNPKTRRIEGTIAGGRWSHLCGRLAGLVTQVNTMPARSFVTL